MNKVQLIKVIHQDDGVRIDRWFKRHFPKVSHIMVEKALRKGQIRLDGKRVKANTRVAPGQEVRVPPLVEKEERKGEVLSKAPRVFSPAQIAAIRNSVIYEDKHVIALNKDPGLAVQGGSGVSISVDDLKGFLVADGEDSPKLAHRIDKDTSGILLLAKDVSAAAKLAEAFRQKKAHKTYLAITVGQPPKEREGVINLPIRKAGGFGNERMIVDKKEGQKAKTYYRLIETLPNKISLVELQPVTGRTHQLRVHMEAIGTPILGDGKYGGKDAFMNGLADQLHLHAYQIDLPHILGKRIHIKADLPKHMKESFDTLGFELPE
jgi:23S rRNA pseudouridine955/2504/2580 synthase